MRDMFYNYDYRIGHKEYAKNPKPDFPEQMEGNSNIKVIRDIFGNEKGVRAYKDSIFQLYFFLRDHSCCGFDDDIQKVLTGSKIIFEILDYHYNVLYTQVIDKKTILDDTVIVELGTDSTIKLDLGVYRMKLIAVKDDKQYVVFHEDDGLLHIV